MHLKIFVGRTVFHDLILSAAAKHDTRTHAQKKESEKMQPLERRLDFLLVVYLFINFCRISSLSPRSEVQPRNAFPPNKEKLTRPAHTV